MTQSQVRHDAAEALREEAIDDIEEVGRFLTAPFLAVAAVITYGAIQVVNRIIHARDDWRHRVHG